MNAAAKKKAAVIAGGIALLLLSMRRTGKGTVLLGPVTVTSHTIDLGKVTDADLQRLTLALTQSRRLMGADPNTLASRQPSPSEQSYIEQTLASARVLSQVSKGGLVYPLIEEQRLTLAKKLPGDTLQKANAQLYQLLGVHPAEDNEPTVALTPASEAAARTLIAKWRPYSQSAVDTLFVLLDGARELGGLA